MEYAHARQAKHPDTLTHTHTFELMEKPYHPPSKLIVEDNIHDLTLNNHFIIYSGKVLRGNIAHSSHNLNYWFKAKLSLIFLMENQLEINQKIKYKNEKAFWLEIFFISNTLHFYPSSSSHVSPSAVPPPPYWPHMILSGYFHL